MAFAYEFNAPSHFCDLTDMASGDPDDTYFDCQGESGPLNLATPQVDPAASRSSRASSRHNVGTPRSMMKMGTPRRPQDVKTPKAKPSKAATPKKPYTPKEPMEETDDKENQGQQDTGTKAKMTKSFSPAVGARSSPRLAAKAAKEGHSSPRLAAKEGRLSPTLATIAKAMTRSKTTRRSAGSRKSSGGSTTSNLGGVNKHRTRNKPSVPKVQGMKGLSQEDRSDLEAITTFKQTIARNKKKGESTASGACLAPTVPHEFNFATDNRLRNKNEEPVAETSKSAAPLKATHHGSTKPKEFHFATDNRIKRSDSNVAEEESVGFQQSLRSGSGAKQDRELPKGPTIPQPFNLTETRKPTGSELNKFVSVAELNLKFHTRTPQRFRSKRHGGSQDSLDQDVKKMKSNSGVTIPVTPKFASRTRSRQVNYLTREEEEQKEFEEQQKHQFKANPLNKRVFEAPPEGSQAVQRKTSTIPEPFNITKTKKEEAPLGDNFKEMCNKLGCSTASIASLPWGGVPSKWDKTNTKIQPFSFDARDKHKMQRKQEMIQKVIEDQKKLAHFEAQPMPVFEDGMRTGVPERRTPTPTKAKPFNLRCDQRGEDKLNRHVKNLEEEDRLDKERRKFQAQSDEILHRQPFIPEKSKKPLTDISGFSLNTEVRAEGRTEFELHQKQREDELAAAKLEQENRQAEEEAAEVAKIRREAVHKAQPVKHFKPLEIHPAPVPPTVPISPNLATKSRGRARNSNSMCSADSTMDVSSATFTTE